MLRDYTNIVFLIRRRGEKSININIFHDTYIDTLCNKINKLSQTKKMFINLLACLAGGRVSDVFTVCRLI